MSQHEVFLRMIIRGELEASSLEAAREELEGVTESYRELGLSVRADMNVREIPDAEPEA